MGSRSRVFVAAVAFGLAWFRASPISAQTGEPAAFRAYHDQVFFSSNNELWRTDGTRKGTQPLGSEFRTWVRAEGHLFFELGVTLFGVRDDLHTVEQLTGDNVIVDLGFAGFRRSAWDAEHRILYFVARTPGLGWQIWRSDGTKRGTIAATRLPQSGYLPTQLCVFHGALFFNAANAPTGSPASSALWRSLGTPQSTQVVLSGMVVHQPQVLDDRFVFLGFGPLGGGRIWTSDGTSGGTAPVSSLPDAEYFTNIVASRTIGDRALYLLEDPAGGRQLWGTDGTSEGTQRLTSFPSGAGFPDYFSFVSTTLRGSAAFAVDDGLHGVELWLSGGTRETTRLLKDVCPGICSGAADGGIVIGTKLLFPGHDAKGWEPWVSDGTRKRTHRVADTCLGSCGDYAPRFSALGSTAIFTSDDGDTHRLWITDGSAAHTFALATFRGSNGVTPFFDNPSVSGRLIFAADDSSHGLEPWSTDGTPAGTRLLKDTRPSQ